MPLTADPFSTHSYKSTKTDLISVQVLIDESKRIGKAHDGVIEGTIMLLDALSLLRQKELESDHYDPETGKNLLKINRSILNTGRRIEKFFAKHDPEGIQEAGLTLEDFSAHLAEIEMNINALKMNFTAKQAEKYVAKLIPDCNAIIKPRGRKTARTSRKIKNRPRVR